MSNNAEVFVDFDFDKSELTVKATLNFKEPISSFRFSLSTLMEIECITADEEVSWKILKEWKPVFQHESNETLVECKSKMSKLKLTYHGKISGWCNIIEEKRVALSFYSAWTILETSEPMSYKFILNNLENYLVIKGTYDSTKKLWIYNGNNKIDPGNIIALKNGEYKVSQTGNLSFYYLHESEKVHAETYAHYYDKILNYYSSVFRKKDINKMDIVSLGLDNTGNAYLRDELVVIEKLQIDADIETIKEDAISLLAHELGHNWFMGADTTSWEDWLNETGAEWAARLFILSLEDYELFNKKFVFLYNEYLKTPPIKTPDGSRPDGVHWRGTVMFYEIYKKYGTDTIINILQTMSSLNEQTTSNFIKELRVRFGDEIPNLIEKGLELHNYSDLFSE